MDQELLLAKLKEFQDSNSMRAADELKGKYMPAPAPMAMEETTMERPVAAEIVGPDGDITLKSSISSENGADGLGDPMQLLSALSSEDVMKLLGSSAGADMGLGLGLEEEEEPSNPKLSPLSL